MNIFVGFDGGGTYSRYIIQKDDASPTFHHFRESIKPSETSIEYTFSRLIAHLQAILQTDISDIKGMCISLSGLGSNGNKEALSNSLASAFQLKTANVDVESDSLIGLEAAYQTAEHAGIFAIVGTGSVITAHTLDGQILKAGGWGKEFGDQGSAHAIGVESMRYYCSATDELIPKGMLYENITQYLELKVSNGCEEIQSYISSGKVVASEIAGITLLVVDKDDRAKLLVTRSVMDIVSDICTFHKHYREQLPKIVTLHGGMLSNNFYKELITNELQKSGFKVEYLEDTELLLYTITKAKGLAG